MWIINALIVHLFLLGSIFVIYFRSPVIRGLNPQTISGYESPARRVVIMVTDGLRAESFFRNDFADLGDLRKLFESTGIVGISNTRVPTESRPGHIALLAGLYEDPSAVTRGWKENPIEFDTVFNRSAHTYAWGAHDILHIFSRLTARHDKNNNNDSEMFFDAYVDNLDFSGHNKTWALDEWVFKRVRQFLKRKSATIQPKQQVIFFLHLLGLDTAGHVHKPGAELFLENLHYTQRQIVQMYELFEETFNDAKTAYILTSDHGMTDAGSHGAGGIHETETPFFLWGAGITSKPLDMNNLPSMEQAQFAPLISALIGTAPPMNNFGIIPAHVLNVSAEYLARFSHTNALQLLAQYEALWQQHQQGYFSNNLRTFRTLPAKRLSAYKSTIHKYFKHKDWKVAMVESRDVMYRALEGIDYYHNYYQRGLLLSTTITFMSCICYSLGLLHEKSTTKTKSFKMNSNPKLYENSLSIFICVLGLLLQIFCLLQGIPLVIAFYLILPLPVFWLAFRKNSFMELTRRLSLSRLLVLFICAELLVYTFFMRALISVCFLLYACTFNLRALSNQPRACKKFYLWVIICFTVALFPLLPSAVGHSHVPLLLLGVALTFIRTITVKFNLKLQEKIIYLLVFANALLCIYQHTHQLQIKLLSYIINWAFLLYVFLSILVQPVATTVIGLKQRVEFIVLNFTALYALLSTSYELLFVVLLATELMLTLNSQHSMAEQQQLLQYLDLHKLQQATQNNTFQMAMALLLYTFFSFFGTGNIASVSSFDPNIARCFLSTFAPFTIMMLVILKLTLPIVLNVTIILGISTTAREEQRNIFLWLLVFCDVMGLNFLYLVRNQGSWLEIGSSISHFVIMEATTLVLLLLTILARCLLKINIPKVEPIKVK